MNDADRLYIRGAPNRKKFSWMQLLESPLPDPLQAEKVAELLKRPVFFVDRRGHQHEIMAGAISPTGDLAYVESAAKGTGFIDITMTICLRCRRERRRACPAKSYNPFYGCVVRFLRWIQVTAILVYREKHATYVARFSQSVWPPQFIRISDAWVIRGDRLAYCADEAVYLYSLPGLFPPEPISIAEATALGLFSLEAKVVDLSDKGSEPVAASDTETRKG